MVAIARDRQRGCVYACVSRKCNTQCLSDMPLLLNRLSPGDCKPLAGCCVAGFQVITALLCETLSQLDLRSVTSFWLSVLVPLLLLISGCSLACRQLVHRPFHARVHVIHNVTVLVLLPISSTCCSCCFQDVLWRVGSSFIGLLKPDFMSVTMTSPDLYGPFWIATTLIFVIAGKLRVLMQLLWFGFAAFHSPSWHDQCRPL